MKRIIYIAVGLIIIGGMFVSICSAQGASSDENKNKEEKRTLDESPEELLITVTNKANLYYSDKVQNTKLNGVNSRTCDENIAAYSNFTITKTLCNIKQGIRPYLQYIIWAGLTAATILIIRNGFLLVTSSDRGKQIGVFKKNIIYIIIGVALIISFYWILDIFVSLINFVAE